tara:strand:+ start:231 stop:398 length:168 start_codon:yes stop_codon:yes gene_type:complete
MEAMEPFVFIGIILYNESPLEGGSIFFLRFGFLTGPLLSYTLQDPFLFTYKHFII